MDAAAASARCWAAAPCWKRRRSSPGSEVLYTGTARCGPAALDNAEWLAVECVIAATELLDLQGGGGGTVRGGPWSVRHQRRRSHSDYNCLQDGGHQWLDKRNGEVHAALTPWNTPRTRRTEPGRQEKLNRIGPDRPSPTNALPALGARPAVAWHRAEASYPRRR